jgi:GMP synthase (glutamine-hydrolysing)
VAAVENVTDGMFGVQFHPEVLHTEHGARILARFLELAGCRPSWTMLNIVEEQVTAIREQVGDGRAICGLSGGVDSAVAAALVQRAIGDRLTCVFVDHGLLRKGEAEQVEQDFVAATGVKLTVATEAEAFLSALAGAVDPEQKRKIIGREFIRAFERAAREITAEAGEHGEACEFLVQGTLYPTWWSPAAAPAPPTSSPTTTSAGCRRPEVPAGRAAALAVQGRGAPRWGRSSACRPRSSAASRSPARAWPSGSSAR